MNNPIKTNRKHICKLRHPCRNQFEMKLGCLDEEIPENHKARKIWSFVKELDTEPLFRDIKTLQGCAGQASTSPLVLLALWLYGLVEGISSARKITELCDFHDAYRWLKGGVPINRTMMSNFRTSASSMFQDLLTNSLAVMIKHKLLLPEDIAQDGTRLKAAAGFNTYRGEKSLKELVEVSQKHFEEVESLSYEEIKEMGNRKYAAEKRAAREQVERAKVAVDELHKHQEEIKENKANRTAKEVEQKIERCRASHQDTDARKMKMGDGGYRMAYNLQFATGTKSRAILGVKVVKSQDPGTLVPLMEQVHYRINKLGVCKPKIWLADKAYSGANDINNAYARFPNCRIAAPPKGKHFEKAIELKKGDSKGVVTWKKFLNTEEYKVAYKKRCSTAEFSNMTTKLRGLGILLVRGLEKVTSQALLYGIMHNMMRFWDLSIK